MNSIVLFPKYNYFIQVKILYKLVYDSKYTS